MFDDIKWIRMKVGMFDGNSFKKIKRAKIGGVQYRDKLTSVWFELLDLAAKSNKDGYLIDNNGVPYKNYEEIATQIDRDEKEVELCMSFFESEKMIEFVDDMFCVTNFVQYQNQDGLAQIRENNRLRQARFREKRNCLIGDVKCQYCGGKATGYDHIIPLSQGGTDDASNKVHCCNVCNNIKSTQPLVKFLNANRERINDDIVTSNPLLMKYVTLCNVTNRYVDNVTSQKYNALDKEKDSLLNKLKNKLYRAGAYTGVHDSLVDEVLEALVKACEMENSIIFAGRKYSANHFERIANHLTFEQVAFVVNRVINKGNDIENREKYIQSIFAEKYAIN